MKTTFPAICLLALVTVAGAQEVPPPKPSAPVVSEPAHVFPAAATPAATPVVNQYRAHTKSTFVPPEKGRNPFWPIGFTPRAKTAVNEEQLLRIPIEQYKVTSIILDTPSIAVINGKDYTRGQFLPLATTTGTVKLLITNIEDGVVTVQYKALVGKIPISRK
ncbi:MAG: hypothetical protein ABIT76_03865 [Chthoniobacterales bacterium]